MVSEHGPVRAGEDDSFAHSLARRHAVLSRPGRSSPGSRHRCAVLLLSVALFLQMGAATASVENAPFMLFDLADAPEQFQPVPERAGMTRFATLDAISLEGAAGTARLVVNLALPPDARPGVQPLDARVTYRPDGFVDYWETPDLPGSDAFAFTLLDLSGPQPQIEGSFQVRLCRRASVMQPADPKDCRTARGTFASELQID